MDSIDKDRINLTELTVSELSIALKRTIENAYDHVRVRGELGKVSYHSNGHVYFDLKDDRASISGVIWRNVSPHIKLRLEAGLEVIVTGRITTYPGRSQYQIVVESLEAAGLGALMALVEERKKKLAAEGLFDAARKQLLPFLPNVIGVVTSPTGAVIRDILHRLADRFPRHVLLWPVRVQGEGSATEVASAIDGLNSLAPDGPIPRPDLIIVARGGGSLEDLWSFNEEIVVRAAANSMVPLISAVGHETDVTLIDFAADKRAPTPTAAAEMAVPVRTELLDHIDSFARRALACWHRSQQTRRTELRAVVRGLPNTEQFMAWPRQRLDHVTTRLPRALNSNAQIHRAIFSKISGGLSSQLLRSKIATGREQSIFLAQRLMQSLRVQVERRRDREVAGSLRLNAARSAYSKARGIEIARAREQAVTYHVRAKMAIFALLQSRFAHVDRAGRLLQAVSYHDVLARGFALVRDSKGQPLRRAAEIQADSLIDIEFSDGRILARTNVPASGPARQSGPADSPPTSPSLKTRSRRGGGGSGQGSLFN
jgi:exodeoxyribonuclease VII large subunit